MKPHERWHKALDIQMEMQKWSMSDRGRYYHEAFIHQVLGMGDTPHLRTHEQLASALQVVLYRADTMYITTEMEHLLMQAAHDLPEGTKFEEVTLLSPFGFCYLEETIYGVDKAGQTISVKAFAWEDGLFNLIDRDSGEGKTEHGVILYFFSDSFDENDSVSAGVLKESRVNGEYVPPLMLSHFYITTYDRAMPEPERQGSHIVTEMCKLFAATMLIAHQPIGEPMQMRPNRATRKRAISWDRDNERYITLITLRRKRVARDDDEPQKVEWSHRWVVRGHWRNQYHPKTDTHEWKYIHEYVKGPEDKPLLVSERRVFDFRR